MNHRQSYDLIQSASDPSVSETFAQLAMATSVWMSHHGLYCYPLGNHSSDIMSISRKSRRARIKKRIDGGTFTRGILIRHANSQEQIKCRRCEETVILSFAASKNIYLVRESD